MVGFDRFRFSYICCYTKMITNIFNLFVVFTITSMAFSDVNATSKSCERYSKFLKYVDSGKLMCSFLPFDESKETCQSIIKLLEDINDIECKHEHTNGSTAACDVVTVVGHFVNQTKPVCDVIPNTIGKLTCKLVFKETSQILTDVCDPKKSVKYINPRLMSSADLGCHISKSIVANLADDMYMCSYIPSKPGRRICHSIVSRIRDITDSVCNHFTSFDVEGHKLELAGVQEAKLCLAVQSIPVSSTQKLCKWADDVLSVINVTHVCTLIPNTEKSIGIVCERLVGLTAELVATYCYKPNQYTQGSHSPNFSNDVQPTTEWILENKKKQKRVCSEIHDVVDQVNEFVSDKCHGHKPLCDALHIVMQKVQDLVHSIC